VAEGGDALEHELQRFPVDRRGHFECHQRIGEEGAQQICVGELLTLSGKARPQQQSVCIDIVDPDQDLFARRLDVEAIGAVHIDEGRDIELLGAALFDRGRARLYGNDVGTPLAECVVHLVEDRLELVAVPAEPDREWIEDVAQNARIAEDADLRVA